MTYKEKLLDPRWTKKRCEILQRDDFTCQICWKNDLPLTVHHKKYCGEPWEAPNEDLTTVCVPCHENISTYQGLIKKLASLEQKIKDAFNKKLSREIDLIHSLLS